MATPSPARAQRSRGSVARMALFMVLAFLATTMTPMGMAQAQTPDPTAAVTATVEVGDPSELPNTLAAMAEAEGLVFGTLAIEMAIPQDGAEPAPTQTSSPTDNGPPAELTDGHGGIFTAAISPVTDPAEGLSTVRVDWKAVAGSESLIVALHALHAPDGSNQPRAFVLSGNLVGFELIEGALVFAPGTETSGSFLLSQGAVGAVLPVLALSSDNMTLSLPAPAPAEPTTEAPAPAPAEPTTEAPAPAPVEPTTEAPAPAPVEPTTEAPAPAPVEPTTEEASEPAPSVSRMAPMAVAAEPIQIDNVVLQVSRKETGTGHGTDAQCFLSTRGGVPTGPLDDSPEDAYVCTRDSVDYKIDFSVAALSEPTSVRIKLDEIANASLSRNTLTNFCTPSAGSFDAVRNDAAGKDCTFTFPAGSSQTGSWPIVYETRYGTESIWTPQYEATVNQAAAQVIPAEGFQVLMTPVGDLWFYSDAVKYVERDGKVYARYAYGPVLRHTGLPVTSPATSRAKGLRYDNWDRFEVTTTLDLGAAPLDNAIITGSNQTVVKVNPDKTVTFAASNVGLSGASGMSLGRTFAHVFVDIPVDDFAAGVTTSWQPHFYDTRMIVRDGVYANNNMCPTCSYTHPDLYGGLFDQPGEGRPVDFVTNGWMGVGHGGQTRPNNDWNLSSFDRLPDGDLFGKHIADGHLSEAAPGPLMPTNTSGQRRPYDHKFWTKLYTVSAPVNVDEQLVFCDAYENLTRSADNGLAFYDPSRTPDIFRYSSVDGSKIPITDYQLWFKTVGIADNPSASQCGDATDLTGWTQDPTGADTIKVIIPGEFNLVGNGTTSVEAWLPFRAGPESAYPEWPGATIIRNVGTAVVDPELGEVFPTGVPRHWYLGGRFSSASGDAGFFSPGGVWVTPRPTELSSGMYTSAAVRNFAGLSDGVKSEVSSDAIHVTGSIQLDSCMVDPTNIRVVKEDGYALGSPAVSNFEYTITSADPGPDGVACTADDVGGAVIDYSYDSEPSYAVVTFDFQVSDLARPGSTLSFTRTGEATFEEPGAVAQRYSNTATVRVVTPQVLGQMKTRTHVLEPVGTRVGWLLTMFNNTPNPVLDVEFIDVLPYNGDGRRTDLTAALEQVRLDTADMAGARVYVSTAAPDSIPRVVTDPAVDPSNTAMWCQYGTAGCAEGEGITAVYLWFDRMAPAQYNTLGVSVGTANQSDDDLLVNDMGTGGTPSVSLPVQPTRMVETRLYEPRNLSGTVYIDYGRDGDQGTGDPGVPGWDVTLSFPGAPDRSTETNTEGYYEFTELRPGTYLVTIADPAAGQILTQSYLVVDPTGATTDPAQPATIVDADVREVDFGLWEPASLSGHVYLDADRNGELGEADALQPDQTLTLHFGEAEPRTTTTDANGYYEFTDLVAGTYQVSWVTPDGHVATQVFTVSDTGGITMVDGRHTTEPIQVPYAGRIMDVDFGYMPVYDLSGTVYGDDDRNGAMNGAELGIDGWDVTLTGPEGFEPRNAITSDGGYYEFTSLNPGAYTVTIRDPGSDYVITQSYLVVDPTGATTDPAQPVTIVDADVREVDFGIVAAGKPISIAKLSTDGQPLAGAEFTLTGPDGPVEVTASADGTTFTTAGNLIYGNRYTLTETKAPAGHELLAEPVVFTMTADGITITSGGSDLVTVDSTDTFLLKVGDVTTLAELPNAGGEGVQMLGALGGLFLAACAVSLLVYRRRQGAGA